MRKVLNWLLTLVLELDFLFITFEENFSDLKMFLVDFLFAKLEKKFPDFQI